MRTAAELHAMEVRQATLQEGRRELKMNQASTLHPRVQTPAVRSHKRMFHMALTDLPVFMLSQKSGFSAESPCSKKMSAHSH